MRDEIKGALRDMNSEKMIGLDNIRTEGLSSLAQLFDLIFMAAGMRKEAKKKEYNVRWQRRAHFALSIFQCHFHDC